MILCRVGPKYRNYLRLQAISTSQARSVTPRPHMKTCMVDLGLVPRPLSDMRLDGLKWTRLADHLCLKWFLVHGQTGRFHLSYSRLQHHQAPSAINVAMYTGIFEDYSLHKKMTSKNNKVYLYHDDYVRQSHTNNKLRKM